MHAVDKFDSVQSAADVQTGETDTVWKYGNKTTIYVGPIKGYNSSIQAYKNHIVLCHSLLEQPQFE